MIVVVYAVSVFASDKGLHTSAHGSDVTLYATDAHRIVGGAMPYRSLYFEYPPGALIPLLAAEPFGHYAYAFKLSMALLGLVTLAVCAAVLASLGREPFVPLLVVAVSPLALGSVFLNRYDLWPAFLTTAALALLLRNRVAAFSAVSALATVAKIYPAAAVPAAMAWIGRRFGGRIRRRAILIWVAVGFLLLLPFAALGPGGLRFSFTIQATRHLETESLAGSLLLVADRLGLYRADIHTGKPGSLDIFGVLPGALGAISVLVVIAAIVWITWKIASGPTTGERLVAATAAAVTAYVAFGKVLSPQYLVWLVPLVPLVRGRLPSVLLLVSLVLTQIEFDHDHAQIHTVGRVVWVLLARNVALVVLAVVLLADCVPRYRPDVDPVNEHVAVSRAA